MRDRNWNTLEPEIEDCAISGEDPVGVSYCARCRDPDTSSTLAIDVSIEMAGNGSLRFQAVAVPDGDFLTARCGFAVLHPLAGVAGCPVNVEHVDGSVEETAFPERIAPWQPFKDIRGADAPFGARTAATLPTGRRHLRDGGPACLSDASFKTYVRPLALPWPYVLPPGRPLRQAVTLEVSGAGPAEAGRDGVAAALELGAPCGRMPAIGVLIQPNQVEDAMAHPEWLADLAPALLLLHLDPITALRNLPVSPC